MNTESKSSEFNDLNEENRRSWDSIAEWWDDKIGDGNQFQLELIEPATKRLLEIHPGTTVLDIACGAGRFARQMVEMGAYVVAIDFSERFIRRAKMRMPPEMKNIEYHVIDATDREGLLSLGSHRFDGAVATMALMDIASIEPLMNALPLLLKQGGWFVFTVMHPCFQAPESSRFAESVESDGQFSVKSGVRITRYMTPVAWKGVGIPDQPESYYYFDRPLSVLFNIGFDNGFAVDGLVEPILTGDPKDTRFLRWDNMPEIPPILAVRMRLTKQ
ncbi:MAG: class I SAM-dependent methyltransferase [Dehalococcoidales bacterium]